MNSSGYRFGPAVLWAVQAQYQPAEWFAAALGVDGRWAAPDVSLGVDVDSTGGLVLAAVPAVYFNGSSREAGSSPGHSSRFATKLYGVQGIGPVVTAGLRYDVAGL